MKKSVHIDDYQADVPFGGLNPEQMETVAVLAEEFSDGVVHVTPEQALRLHFVHENDRAEVMRRLAAVGLTLREKSQIGSRVTVLLPNGDLTAEQMRGLADLARRYSGGNVRATSDQNLVLRWIRSTLVGPLSRDIEAIGLVTEATE